MSPSTTTSGAAPAQSSPVPTRTAAPTASLAREVPAPDPLLRVVNDPAHESLGPKNGLPGEPVLNIGEIQGNILAGFTKDYQTLLFLEIDDPQLFQAWLGPQIPFIATTAEVLAFNRLFKAVRFRRKVETNTAKETSA